MFQELTTRKVIGSTREREGLYYLVIEEQGKIQVHQIKRKYRKKKENFG